MHIFEWETAVYQLFRKINGGLDLYTHKQAPLKCKVSEGRDCIWLAHLYPQLWEPYLVYMKKLLFNEWASIPDNKW
jgi:hypothetical protein